MRTGVGMDVLSGKLLIVPVMVGSALVIVALILCVKRRKLRRPSSRSENQDLTVNEERPSRREVVESVAYASFNNHRDTAELPSDEEDHCYATINKTEGGDLSDHHSEAGGYETIEFVQSDDQKKFLSQSDADPYASIELNTLTDQSDHQDNVINQSEENEQPCASSTVDKDDVVCPYSTVNVKSTSEHLNNQNETAVEVDGESQSSEATLQKTPELMQTIRRDTILAPAETTNNSPASTKAGETESEV